MRSELPLRVGTHQTRPSRPNYSYGEQHGTLWKKLWLSKGRYSILWTGTALGTTKLTCCTLCATATLGVLRVACANVELTYNVLDCIWYNVCTGS